MIITLTAIITALTLLGLSKKLWFFTIFDFFRIQYAFVSVILIFISIYYANYFLCAVNFTLILINLYRIRHFLPRPWVKPSYTSKTLMSVNAYDKNNDLSKLTAAIDIFDPEILLIMEVTEKLHLKLKDVFARYPYKLETPVRDGFRICLLSRHPMKNDAITHHGDSDSPLIKADFDIKGKKFTVFSGHPKPAFNKKWDDDRHAYFSEIEKIISNTPKPKIIMGDFNSVPWERHFVSFLKNTGMKSTLIDHGYKVTWPSYFLPMGIPMDHILISDDINYTDLTVGPNVGSDHYPISLDII